MDCNNCLNNLAKDKKGYSLCAISLLKENKVEYNEEKQEFICDKENLKGGI